MGESDLFCPPHPNSNAASNARVANLHRLVGSVPAPRTRAIEEAFVRSRIESAQTTLATELAPSVVDTRVAGFGINARLVSDGLSTGYGSPAWTGRTLSYVRRRARGDVYGIADFGRQCNLRISRRLRRPGSERDHPNSGLLVELRIEF